MADHESSTDNTADMERIADGHRAMPRYPDGREFDLCCDDPKHLSEIRNFRDDFDLERSRDR
jgi:hypothetical protein